MTSYGTVLSYPIPAYQNLPIESQYYQPSRFVISAITLGVNTTVTTTENMNYVIGQLVRLLIPPSYGCWQLNETESYVISLPAANQVTLDLDSTGSDAYIASSSTVQSAQILAIGDVNQGQTNSNGPLNTTEYIPGSFINISPL